MYSLFHCGDVDCWLAWKDIYVRLCACFFFSSSSLHKNGVKWYMTGRMFWIYCDYYIFLSFGYYYCCCFCFCCRVKRSIVEKSTMATEQSSERRNWWLFSRCYFLIFSLCVFMCGAVDLEIAAWSQLLVHKYTHAYT